MHCDTEEKAKLFLVECEHQDIKWGEVDEPTTRTYFEVYGEFTCYSCIWKNSSLGYCNVDFYKGNRSIIDYTSNFQEVKRSAKVGEWIKLTDIRPCHSPSVNNGELLYIDHLTNGKAATVKGNNFANSEYVVLELIAPTTEEPNPFDLSTISTDALLGELRKRVQEK